jgi:hypothetical protein
MEVLPETELACVNEAGETDTGVETQPASNATNTAKYRGFMVSGSIYMLGCPVGKKEFFVLGQLS